MLRSAGVGGAGVAGRGGARGVRRDDHPAGHRRRGVEHDVSGGDHGVVHVHGVGDVVRFGVVRRGRTEWYAR